MSNLNHCPEKTALVLQGGGARGAYQVGAIKAIAEITACRRSPFRIVCGASVGTINAASIAAASNDFQSGAKHLEKLWRSLTSSSIFDTRVWPLLLTGLRWAMTPVLTRLGFPTIGGFLNYEPLRRMLEKEFRHDHLRHAISTGALHALSITASSYSQGSAVTFFQGQGNIEGWSRSRRRGERTIINPRHILASTALPFAFSPVLLKHGYFGDGSLRLTSPLSPAIHLGAERILVISTRDGEPELPDASDVQSSPTISEMSGHALDILFNDSLESDHERLTRINQTISLLGPDARLKTPLRFIETVMLRPSQDIRGVAFRHARNLPWAIKALLNSIGRFNSDGRIESYLMFEPEYVGALIDLGYSDTMDRAEAILELLQKG
jgi:NTE family protein